ncbi:MAG: acyl-CoA thioesterase [Bacteroidales bacterium]|nr:acyl-CoA thioesterase [Bacteroidales bacterium]
MNYDFDTTTFNHNVEIQIRFADLDALNHVNNGFQCHYFDVGRVNYFQDTLKRKINLAEIDLVLVHTEFDFLSPIEGNDEIIVQSKTLSFGKKSVKMFQRIIDKNSGKVKTTCYSVLSAMDTVTKQSKEVPEEYKKVFSEFDKLN